MMTVVDSLLEVVPGAIARGLDANNAVNKLRVGNIVGYIESIQVK